MEDWLKKYRKKGKNPGKVDELKQIKILSAVVGLIVMLLSFVVGYIPGNLFDVIQKTANLVVAPLFVLFFLALFVPFSTEKGTFIAGAASMLFAVAIAFWEFLGIKSLWIMPASLIFGIVVGVIASYIETNMLVEKHKHG
jgi:SSS family solute:Na+ symporter